MIHKLSWLFITAGVCLPAWAAHPHTVSAVCSQAHTVRALYRLENTTVADDLEKLLTFVCMPGNENPTGSIFYPTGQYAFVGPGFSDKGSWKYPSGGYAFVGPGYSDHDSWKYPNGGYAFVGPGFSDHDSWKYASGGYAFAGPGFSDHDSWKYPSGGYAFVGPGFSDHDSWKYPDGGYAFVGPGFSDHDSWKYPGGGYAYAGPGFSDAGTWYYPTKVIYSQSTPANTDGKTILAIYAIASGKVYEEGNGRGLPEALRTLLRLKWLGEQF